MSGQDYIKKIIENHSMEYSSIRFEIWYVFPVAYFTIAIILIFLQIYLSKKQNRIAGLIIPTFSLILNSILAYHSLIALALYNIPTVIYLLIYFYYKNKVNPQAVNDSSISNGDSEYNGQLEKMKI